MVSGSEDSSPTFRSVGNTYSRPVRHTVEPKVEAFYSRLPDPLALPGDPLVADWSRGLLYLYPPLALLAQALHKIVREEAQGIAIIPWWPRRGWFPMVLQLLIDLLLVMLPERDGLLSGVDGVDYPDLHTLRLAAWRLWRSLRPRGV